MVTTNPDNKRQPDSWPFIGQAVLGAHLVTADPARRFVAGQLWIGPAALGKRQAALWLAQREVCTHPNRKPCQQCSACRLVKHYQHPNVNIQEGKAEQPIGIDGIRQLLRQRQFRLGNHETRWLILTDIEWLTESAANALLKLLEEPPQGFRIILTSSRPDQVLPTIRSRCAVYLWHLVKATEFSPNGLDGSQADFLARAAGRPGIFVELQKNSKRLSEEIQVVQELANALASRNPFDWTEMLARVGPKPEETLQFWTLVIRELLLLRLNSKKRRLWPSISSPLQVLAQKFNTDSLINLLQRAQRAPELLQQHVVPKHVATEILLA